MDRAGNEFRFETLVVFNATSPLELLNELSYNATLPANGRVELIFNHKVAVVDPSKVISLQHNEESMITLPVTSSRFLRVEGNRVFVFLDESRPLEGAVTLKIPASTFASEVGEENEEITMNVWMSSKTCNTQYVVGGMHNEKCKCFSVGDRCQCSCGETHFSRLYM